MDLCLEELWSKIFMTMSRGDIFHLSTVCQGFANVIAKVNWSDYFYSRLEPTIHFAYPKTITADFMIREGWQLLDATEEKRQQLNTLLPELLRINQLLCLDNGDLSTEAYEHFTYGRGELIISLAGDYHGPEFFLLGKLLVVVIYDGFEWEAQQICIRKTNGKFGVCIAVYEHEDHKATIWPSFCSLLRTMISIMLTSTVNRVELMF